MRGGTVPVFHATATVGVAALVALEGVRVAVEIAFAVRSGAGLAGGGEGLAYVGIGTGQTVSARRAGARAGLTGAGPSTADPRASVAAVGAIAVEVRGALRGAVARRSFGEHAREDVGAGPPNARLGAFVRGAAYLCDTGSRCVWVKTDIVLRRHQGFEELEGLSGAPRVAEDLEVDGGRARLAKTTVRAEAIGQLLAEADLGRDSLRALQATGEPENWNESQKHPPVSKQRADPPGGEPIAVIRRGNVSLGDLVP